MVIPIELEDVLVSDGDTLSGELRFKGTRVPVRALLDSISCGRSVEHFLEGYPGVSREQILAVMKWEQNQARQILGLDVAS